MNDKYIKLTPTMILNLTAPHTWVAAIFPVLLAICVASAESYKISVTSAFVLLAISILLQSATNTLNDYYDYVKGADSVDDNVEESDSVLVYNNVNPRSVKNLALSFILIALLLGIYCIYTSGFFCLLIALIGIAASALYSFGKLPISYLPIGEVVSGFVMGGLITYASYNVLTLDVSPVILVISIPLVINIALIMLTNNVSDIEKDIESQRKTLAVLLGRDRSRTLYRFLLRCSLVSMCVICAVWFTQGVVFYPFLVLLAYPTTKRLMKCDFMPSSRIFAMSQICEFNLIAGSMYCLMILGSSIHLML